MNSNAKINRFILELLHYQLLPLMVVQKYIEQKN